MADQNEQAPASSAPSVPYAKLGRVTMPQCVPATPMYFDPPTQLSPVTAAAVARMLGQPPE